MKILNIGIITATILLTAGTITPIFAGDEHESEYLHSSPEEEGHYNSFYDYARVVKVRAIYKQVKVAIPHKDCWDEHRDRPRKHQVSHENVEKVIVGSIIGGVLGHQLAKGHDKATATAAGALIGAAVGNESRRHERKGHDSHDTKREHRQRCQKQIKYRHEKQADGFNVTYRYGRETFHTRMSHRPGKRLRINVRISLAD